MPIRGEKKQEKFEKLCQQLEGFDKGRHQIVVPDIDKSHYSVIHIIIDNKSPIYITKVLYYDSLCAAKNKISHHEKCPSTNQGVHSEFHKRFQQCYQSSQESCTGQLPNSTKWNQLRVVCCCNLPAYI